jgi:hypothetical protein
MRRYYCRYPYLSTLHAGPRFLVTLRGKGGRIRSTTVKAYYYFIGLPISIRPPAYVKVFFNGRMFERLQLLSTGYFLLKSPSSKASSLFNTQDGQVRRYRRVSA